MIVIRHVCLSTRYVYVFYESEVQMDKKNIYTKVRRISIDEQLSENLIRLEICTLRLEKLDESGEFKDEPDYWSEIATEGEESLALSIRPEKESAIGTYYIDLMSIPKSMVEQFPWKDLKEGQVFLSGEFEVREEQDRDKKVKRYYVRPGAKVFMQIDDDVKEDTKTLYYGVLAKGEKNGKL